MEKYEEIVVATNNKGKLKEIREILKGYKILSLKDINLDVDVVEDQDTFEGNAMKKAVEIYELCKKPVIADDSGLCIEALSDFPGVLSHRFLGENKTDSDRNLDLISRLKDIENRRAKFVTVIAYYDGVNKLISYGNLYGNISFDERGENGFAFDKILELDNNLTVAQLEPEVKNEISARKIALTETYEKIRKLK